MSLLVKNPGNSISNMNEQKIAFVQRLSSSNNRLASVMGLLKAGFSIQSLSISESPSIQNPNLSSRRWTRVLDTVIHLCKAGAFKQYMDFDPSGKLDFGYYDLEETKGLTWHSSMVIKILIIAFPEWLQGMSRSDSILCASCWVCIYLLILGLKEGGGVAGNKGISYFSVCLLPKLKDFLKDVFIFILCICVFACMYV